MPKNLVKRPLNLLIIEDDDEFAHSLELRLSRDQDYPLKVQCVRDLDSARQSLQNYPFHIILLDLTLPDSEGIESYLKIKMFTNGSPVVILTGVSSDDIAHEAVRQGAEDYLVKGEVDGRMISRVIHNAIERNRIKKELAMVSRQLRETNLHLEKMTILDPLTGLYNRRGLQQALSREIQWAERHESPLIAMLLDVDHFKDINDTLGYPVGDVILRELAGTLNKTVRLTDHIARVGGDEFILLLPETDFEEGVKIAERSRLAISNANYAVLEKEKLRLTASIGVMKVNTQTRTIDELLGHIHPLLKKSKMNGRNRVSFEEIDLIHQPGIAQSLNEYLDVLRHGSEFLAVKQPIFDLQSMTISGYEFLSRLKAAHYNMPNDFFRIALENNMLTLVDHHCLRTCLLASLSLSDGFTRHVNILPSTIFDVPVKALLESIPKGQPMDRFCFEISEQQLIGDVHYLLYAVEELRRAGVRIAMDDVGFGHSCLESLIVFEPDVIKLDLKLIQGISDSIRKQKVLERTLKITQDLNTKVIAEGIENQQDLEVLKQMGVLYGQGYHLGRPS